MDLSIIIPTYNEKRNVRDISEKIIKEFKKNKIRGEIIFVDDSSPDGTGEILDILSQKNKEVRVIHRPNKSGLASAVSKGWRSAKGKVLGVIDADLSHNPEKIPRMMKYILKENYEIVIGSRYIKGGKILNWNIVRRLCSKISVALAKLLVDVKDPMSGFFMIKKECVNDLKIESQGFKILLETLIKTDCKKIKEIPISFKDREKGKSKAGFK